MVIKSYENQCNLNLLLYLKLIEKDENLIIINLKICIL